MEFQGVFSMEFHGKRVLGQVPWKLTQSLSKDKCLVMDRLSLSF